MKRASLTSAYTLQDISFDLEKKTILHTINTKFLPGNFYGIIGPNGSGKTTLLDLLAHIKKVATGKLLLEDQEFQSYSRRELAKLIAMVPQDIQLGHDFTVSEIIHMGRHPFSPRFFQQADDKKIGCYYQDLLGLKKYSDRLISTLSGGERQRVAIARSLTQNTPILLLDEATSNLDIQHSLDIMNILKKKAIRENLLVIAAIHDVQLASNYCNKILAMKQGRIIAQGDTKTILTSQLIRQTYDVDANFINTPDGTPLIHYIHPGKLNDLA